MEDHKHPGKQFSSTYQPANRGRKPSKLKKYLKDNNMSAQDYALVFRNVIDTKSVDEIKAMVKTGKDEKGNPLSALIWGLCMAWIADCKRGMSSGGIHAQIMDRQYGRPPQENINTNINADVDVKNMTKAEREELKRNILKQLVEKNKDTIEEIINGEKENQGLSEETGTEKSDQTESE